MRITDYTKVTSLVDENVFIIDGESGTKGIRAIDLAKAILDILPVDNLMDVVKGALPPEMHRNIFRGKNLGSSVTVGQKAAIRNGSFDDLYVGDYWVMGGHNWRIADIDYWLHTGDTELTSHHLVVMPDKAMMTSGMNDSNTTAGGYVGSKAYTTYLPAIEESMASDGIFEDMIIEHREYLSNAVTDGIVSGGAWYDSTLELPNEIMMFGTSIFTPTSIGQNAYPMEQTIDTSQLALCRLNPYFIHAESWQWLRSIVCPLNFVDISPVGLASTAGANNPRGFRPVFAIG